MIEVGFRTFILADSTVSGLIDSRLYGMKLPQDPTLPALVYSRVSGNRVYDTDGETGLARARFQVDAWAEALQDVRELAEAVRKRLSGYRGSAGSETIHGAFLESDQDMYDPELDAHRVLMDFIVWYEESTA